MIRKTSIYDEVSDFMASMNPEKVLQFKSSTQSQKRLDWLLERQKEAGLSTEERNELESYLIVNRIVGLAKARAIKILEK
ncbi:MAG: hypothetical protein MUE30_18545 [Spirosomaceae bacterium]|jgi:hypothetical protein|nr:hypothetical protein [Spirosomataceae bacterium]